MNEISKKPEYAGPAPKTTGKALAEQLKSTYDSATEHFYSAQSRDNYFAGPHREQVWSGVDQLLSKRCSKESEDLKTALANLSAFRETYGSYRATLDLGLQTVMLNKLDKALQAVFIAAGMAGAR